TAARTRDNQDEAHYLVVPLRFAKWYLSEMKDPETTPETDLPVSDYISKIQFFDNSDTLVHEIYPFWQWYQFRNDLPADATPQNVRRAEMAFLQTSGDPISAPDREVVMRDPRLESRSRVFWREADRLIFPDYAAPAQFATLDELLGDPNFSGWA